MFKILSKKAYEKLVTDLDFQKGISKNLERINKSLQQKLSEKSSEFVAHDYCHICKNHFNYKEENINRFGDCIYLDKIGCKYSAKCNGFVDNTVVKIR